MAGADHSIIARRGGPSSPPIARYLPALQRFLVAAITDYHAIIIETSPILQSPDALRLAPLAGVHLHLAIWRTTPRKVVAASLSRFAKAGCPVTGIVLIQVDTRRYLKLGESGSLFYLERRKNPKLIEAKAINK
jgi:Mrp family chromosome partitioning ATPase